MADKEGESWLSSLNDVVNGGANHTEGSGGSGGSVMVGSDGNVLSFRSLRVWIQVEMNDGM